MSDLTAADIKTVLTGSLNITGDWTASLNDAISTGVIVPYGNGPAGAFWRIGGDYRDSGSAAHGQLYHWHYVQALQDASGALAGIRYLGRSGQLWADVTSPSPNRRTFTAALFSGATKLRDITSTQDTSGTQGPTVSMPHFSSWFTCGTSGEYDFIPGTQAAESSCRWEHDPLAQISTKVLPAIDVSLNCTPMASVDYTPYCKGNHETYSIGNTGERAEIGTMPTWSAIHLIEQDAQSLRSVRVNALASGGMNMRSLDATHQSVIAAVDIQPSYTGLRMETNWRFYQGRIQNGSSDYVNPADKTSLWVSAEETAHRPGTNYYAYCVTAEPQYLDMLVESAGQCVLYLAQGGQNLATDFPLQTVTVGGAWSGERNPVLNGVTYKGAGWMSRTELPRLLAWSIRDMTEAAAIYPDTCPRGTAFRSYMRDVVDKNFEFILAYRDAMVAAGHTQWRDEGHHFFQSGGSSIWANGYLSMSVCHCSDIYPTAQAVEYRQHLAKLWNALSAAPYDLGCVAAYVFSTWNENGRLVTVDDLTYSAYSNLACTFNDATDTVLLTGGGDWTPTNGDGISFNRGYLPDAATNPYKKHYLVNVSGASFQVSETPGGAPIDITIPITSTKNIMLAVSNYTPYSFQKAAGGSAYFANLGGAIRAHVASGDAVSTALADWTAKKGATVLGYDTDPKYAYHGEVL